MTCRGSLVATTSYRPESRTAPRVILAVINAAQPAHITMLAAQEATLSAGRAARPALRSRRRSSTGARRPGHDTTAPLVSVAHDMPPGSEIRRDRRHVSTSDSTALVRGRLAHCRSMSTPSRRRWPSKTSRPSLHTPGVVHADSRGRRRRNPPWSSTTGRASSRSSRRIIFRRELSGERREYCRADTLSSAGRRGRPAHWLAGARQR